MRVADDGRVDVMRLTAEGCRSRTIIAAIIRVGRNFDEIDVAWQRIDKSRVATPSTEQVKINADDAFVLDVCRADCGRRGVHFIGCHLTIDWLIVISYGRCYPFERRIHPTTALLVVGHIGIEHPAQRHFIERHAPHLPVVALAGIGVPVADNDAG